MLDCFQFCFNCAFKFNLRRYIKAAVVTAQSRRRGQVARAAAAAATAAVAAAGEAAVAARSLSAAVVCQAYCRGGKARRDFLRLKVGPARCCSPRHRMPFNSRNDISQCF